MSGDLRVHLEKWEIYLCEITGFVMFPIIYSKHIQPCTFHVLVNFYSKIRNLRALSAFLY